MGITLEEVIVISLEEVIGISLKEVMGTSLEVIGISLGAVIGISLEKVMGISLEEVIGTYQSRGCDRYQSTLYIQIEHGGHMSPMEMRMVLGLSHIPWVPAGSLQLVCTHSKALHNHKMATIVAQSSF